MDEEIALDVYSAMLEEVGEIIDNYRTSGLSYSSYLEQLVKFKAIAIFRRLDNFQVRKNTEYFENDLLEIICMQQYGNEESVREEETFYGVYRPEVNTMDLPTLLDYITNHRDNNRPEDLDLNEKETVFFNLLKNKLLRLKFLVFILHLDDRCNLSMVPSFSKLLDLDSLVLSKLYHLKRESVEKRIEKREKCDAMATRYYNRIMKDERSLSFETDEKKIHTLQDRINRSKTLQNKKLRDAQKSTGMGILEIKSVVNLGKSTVWGYIDDIRKLLRALSDFDSATINMLQSKTKIDTNFL